MSAGTATRVAPGIRSWLIRMVVVSLAATAVAVAPAVGAQEAEAGLELMAVEGGKFSSRPR